MTELFFNRVANCTPLCFGQGFVKSSLLTQFLLSTPELPSPFMKRVARRLARCAAGLNSDFIIFTQDRHKPRTSRGSDLPP